MMNDTAVAGGGRLNTKAVQLRLWRGRFRVMGIRQRRSWRSRGTNSRDGVIRRCGVWARGCRAFPLFVNAQMMKAVSNGWRRKSVRPLLVFLQKESARLYLQLWVFTNR